ncbi:MAG: glycerophosphodiester phosphodiesterase family protein [Halieaceae bacterium]|jgi:glycerophosphoryl diester phosphodiesterase|nr:glycerophosphodiester phosphodiesterase family protein [Halieaceae bacterium]
MSFSHRSLVSLFVLAVGVSACREAPRDAPAPGASTVPGAVGIALPALFDCAREFDVTLLQAHRAGDRRGAAENSLAAIDASLADGALFLEIDVARTRDGVLILMHDDTLDRTTTGRGAVADLPYAALSSLTLVDVNGKDTGEPVPTLADALEALDGRGFAQIDRKAPASFDEIATVVEANDASDRVVLITYTIEEAIAVHQRLPEAMISTGIGSMRDVARLRAAGVDLSRITAWLGLGSGKPELDAELAAVGIETSFGDFRAERQGAANYRLMAANGAEVISVDEVTVAARALDARSQVEALFEGCAAP